MLLRLAYLGVTDALAMLRLLPMSDRAKDAEILALRHQITVQRHLHRQRIRFTPAVRALLAALVHRLPRAVLRQIRLLVRPETVPRWHRDLIAAHHAGISRPSVPAGHPQSGRSAPWPCWPGKAIPGDNAASTASYSSWASKSPPPFGAPDRTSAGSAVFLRTQAKAVLAADFFETMTRTGARMYVLAVIEHATRRAEPDCVPPRC